MLAELLVGIELFRPRQRLGLRDGRAEPLPRDHRGDRVKGVLLVVAGGDQRGADARVKTDFLVDGAGIGLEGAGMAPLGFAEHRADQAVEQIDGLVRQAGGEVEGDGDQRRMPALPLVAGDMLHRGAASLAGKLGKARLMHTMPARRIDADRADMLQALDQTEHRDRLRRFRHLAQPGEPALVGFRPTLRQRIEPPTLVGGEPIGQPAMDFADAPDSGLGRRAARARRATGRRSGVAGTPPPPARPDGRAGHSRSRAAAASRPNRRQDACRRAETRAGPAVRPHGAGGSAPRRDSPRSPPEDLDLLCDEREKRLRRPLAGLQRTARIAQIAKHEGVAEAIMIATAAPDRCEVRSR